jgi:hypothetical protein
MMKQIIEAAFVIAVIVFTLFVITMVVSALAGHGWWLGELIRSVIQ